MAVRPLTVLNSGYETGVKKGLKGVNRAPSRRHAAGAFLFASLLVPSPAPVASQRDPTIVQVVRVIDGDTIEVCCIGWKRESIRYIGIDTPET